MQKFWPKNKLKFRPMA